MLQLIGWYVAIQPKVLLAYCQHSMPCTRSTGPRTMLSTPQQAPELQEARVFHPTLPSDCRCRACNHLERARHIHARTMRLRSCVGKEQRTCSLSRAFRHQCRPPQPISRPCTGGHSPSFELRIRLGSGQQVSDLLAAML